MDQEVPKKISADQIEVIGTHGEVVKEATDTHASSANAANFGFGQMKVIKGGPWLLLLLPVVIPIAIFVFFLFAILALFFGPRLFKVVSRNVRRN